MRSKTLQHRSGFQGVVDGINHEARMKYFNMSFGKLCDKFMSSASANDPDLLKNCQHHQSLLNWHRVQNIPPDQLFWEIATIVDKVILKTNTLIVIGASNAVKTQVIKNPLVMLARFLGRISNSTAFSAFAWNGWTAWTCICFPSTKLWWLPKQ